VVELEFVVFTQDAFQFQRIGGRARIMRRLGMNLRAIGGELGVDEKTVRKALKLGAGEG
jgi:hypothetical protein